MTAHDGPGDQSGHQSDHHSGNLWRQCAVVALGILRWPPDVFWAATPAELALAIEGLTGRGPSGLSAPPLTRAELDRLCGCFPDKTSQHPATDPLTADLGDLY